MQFDDMRNRLLPGEKIVWSGQPSQGLLLTPRDGFSIPFSLAWCGFVVFWEYMVLQAHSRTPAPPFFKFFGIPFILAGLYFVLGRFVVDTWVRRGITYAVTDRRVLIVRSGPFSKFVALNLNRLPNMEISENARGYGTITFGDGAPFWGRQGFSNWTPSLDPTPRFLGIESARTVFDQIQRLIPTNA